MLLRCRTLTLLLNFQADIYHFDLLLSLQPFRGKTKLTVTFLPPEAREIR